VAKVTNNGGSPFRGKYLNLKPGQSSDDMATELALRYYGVDGLDITFDSDDNLDNITDGQKRILTSTLGENFADELAIPKTRKKSGLGKTVKKTVEAILPEKPAEEPSEEEPEGDSIE
tara:strand:- start:172 stop:525 length:354 start_codon:yes stop_codon:yes gene_type:complete